MLFDIRGRRKNVVRVVYAVLALLMGGSLFLTVGPFSIGELFNSGGGTGSATKVFDEQAERIERRLANDPKDEALLLALTRARISAGNAQVEDGAAEGSQALSSEAREDYDGAVEAWNRYLKQAGDEPNPTAAQLVAGTFFKLAESGSSSFEELESNVGIAAAAQRIAAEQRPNTGSLSALAIYEFFDGNFAAGDKAVKQTVASVPTKAEAKNVEKQLAEFRQRAKAFDKEKKRFAKAEREAGGGGEGLQNPLEGFGTIGQ